MCKRVRKNTSFTLNDDRRLKQYLEGRVLKGYTLGSSSIYKKLVCKVSIDMAIAELFNSNIHRIKDGSKDTPGPRGWPGIGKGGTNMMPGFRGEEDVV